ncbi:hypothetical protein GH714_037409 [Hevea brasiliensis]|uniref:AtC3H46-like PABC-like domain-containing protein n=1 Tax=Hevea brasiliensis TaxID=3981 RepID=A0A6A6LSF3_HEVBR|nr:hypothetical protein GH714_037409 [Hevea brasiliensis]
MDGYEATRIVFSRIQSLDPEDASKIMGLLLIQDHGEKEMIRQIYPPARLGFSIPPSLTVPNPSSNASSSWSAISDLPSHSEDLISPNGSSLNPASAPFYANGRGGGSDLLEEFQLQDQLSFLNDGSTNVGPKSPDLFYPQLDSSAGPNAAGAAGTDSMHFPSYWGGPIHRRSCSVSDIMGFIHVGIEESDNTSVVSPNKIDTMEQCHEMLRSKSAQQQRAAAASAALMVGEDMHKFGRSRLDRSELVNSASRQIYLTFPADSTFREEDVSNYFSARCEDSLPAERMFGFVTFVYPQTVKIILAKGNPHFVCDARVLVKPYKEKGKVPEKHVLEEETKEQADLQQALELQNRRLMSLQLLDVKKDHHHRALSAGSPIPSSTHTSNFCNHSQAFSSLHSSSEVPKENNCSLGPSISVSAPPEKQTSGVASAKEFTGGEENGSGKGGFHGLQESLEHNLPDSPFASPTKESGEYFCAFINGASETEKDATLCHHLLLTTIWSRQLSCALVLL